MAEGSAILILIRLYDPPAAHSLLFGRKLEDATAAPPPPNFPPPIFDVSVADGIRGTCTRLDFRANQLYPSQQASIVDRNGYLFGRCEEICPLRSHELHYSGRPEEQSSVVRAQLRRVSRVLRPRLKHTCCRAPATGNESTPELRFVLSSMDELLQEPPKEETTSQLSDPAVVSTLISIQLGLVSTGDEDAAVPIGVFTAADGDPDALELWNGTAYHYSEMLVLLPADRCQCIAVPCIDTAEGHGTCRRVLREVRRLALHMSRAWTGPIVTGAMHVRGGRAGARMGIQQLHRGCGEIRFSAHCLRMRRHRKHRCGCSSAFGVLATSIEGIFRFNAPSIADLEVFFCKSSYEPTPTHHSVPSTGVVAAHMHWKVSLERKARA